MLRLETQLEPSRREPPAPALELRLEFVDGSIETFIQWDAHEAERIRNGINPAKLFKQTRIVIADDYSKSVFVCRQINRVDLIYDDPGFSTPLPDLADLVELTEAEFQKHVPVHEPGRLQRRDQRREVGDLMVSFLNLRMRGGSHVYLMEELLVKVPAESQSFMQRLLSSDCFTFRLPGGGQGFLNLQNLIGFTAYPGVRELPADVWLAQARIPLDIASHCV